MTGIVERLRNIGRRSAFVILIALGVLLATAGVFTTVFERELSEHRAVSEAGRRALEAAKSSVPETLSYDFNTVDRQLEAAANNLTGKFRADFTTLSSSVIVPAARRDSIVTTAQVAEGGVISADAGTVTLLLFLNQNTTSTKYEGPRLDGSRIRVTMTKVDENWLISDLVPV